MSLFDGDRFEAFKKGADLIGKAAAEKFSELQETVSEVKDTFTKSASQQNEINEILVSKVDCISDELQAIKDNRHYIKSSRHSIDDMEIEEQQLLATWVQKFLLEMQSRGFEINQNQRTFFTNFVKYVGMLDEAFQIEDLSMLEKMGGSETHKVIYKIFLSLIYLHNSDFSPLNKLSDIDEMFKLSMQSKKDIISMLEERIPSIGLDGLVATYNQDKPLNSFSVASVLGQHIDIKYHPVQDWEYSKDQIANYIRAFALLAIPSLDIEVDEQLFEFSKKQKSFIHALAKKIECQSTLFDLQDLCKNPRRVNVAELRNILEDDSKKFTWILDFIYLDSLKDFAIQNESEYVKKYMQIAQMINLTNSEDFVRSALKFVMNDAPCDVLKDIIFVGNRTKGWEHIFSYRNLSFKNQFSDLHKDLSAISDKCFKIDLELSHLSMDAGNLYSSFEEGLAAKIHNSAIGVSRKNCFDKLEKFRTELYDFLTDITGIHKSNNILPIFGIEKIVPSFECRWAYSFEMDNSGGNEDWVDDFYKFTDILQKDLSKLQNAASLLQDQLRLFEEGRFHESVIENKRKIEEERKIAKAAELSAKATTSLHYNGQQVRLEFVWTTFDSLPFSSEDIKSAVSDGVKWLLLANDALFVCHDNISWTKIDSPDNSANIQSIHRINNTWIVIDSKALWYSSDLHWWNYANLPDCVDMYSIKHLAFDGGNWYLCVDKYVEFTYTTKVLFFNKEEEATYSKLNIYKTSSLDAKWSIMSHASDYKTGMSLSRCNVEFGQDTAVTAFSYDASYCYCKKKSDNEFHLAYLSNSGWKKSTYPKEIRNCDYFLFWGGGFLCFAHNSVFSSTEGFEWSKIADNVSYGGWGDLSGLLTIFPNYGNQLTLSPNGKDFYEMLLEEGRWNILASNKQSLLGVYSPNDHKKILRLGHLVTHHA